MAPTVGSPVEPQTGAAVRAPVAWSNVGVLESETVPTMAVPSTGELAPVERSDHWAHWDWD